MTRYDRTRTMADGVEDIEAFGFGINKNVPTDAPEQTWREAWPEA